MEYAAQVIDLRFRGALKAMPAGRQEMLFTAFRKVWTRVEEDIAAEEKKAQQPGGGAAAVGAAPAAESKKRAREEDDEVQEGQQPKKKHKYTPNFFGLSTAAAAPAAAEEPEFDRFIKLEALPLSEDADLADYGPLREFYCKNRLAFPTAFRVAQLLLCIVATSVSCERVFSIAGNIVTARRSRLAGRLAFYLLSAV